MSSDDKGKNSRRPSASTDISGNKPRRFNNGWTKEQEGLMAQWADVASCYRWLHDRAEKKYSRLSMSINIPVIILSTLTGAANFAVGSFIPPGDESLKNYVSAGLGTVSIITGIITTLGNFFQYAQKSEANRVAGIAWGKFQRLVSVELAISPNDRLDAMDFLQICRQDLDRLIEQSPPISDDVIKMFEKEFNNIPNLKVPDICHGIEHTRVFDSSKPRLANIAADAALHLRYKKNILAKSVMPDIEKKMEEELNGRIEKRIRELMPSPEAPVKEASTHPTGAITNLEQDWRKLLISKRQISTELVNTDSNELLVAPDDIRVNIVGTDGDISAAPPTSPTNHVSDRYSVSSNSIVEDNGSVIQFPLPPNYIERRRPPPPPPAALPPPPPPADPPA